MRRHVMTCAIAILALGTLAIPTTAQAKDGHDHGHSRRVRLLDNCDPATFNAAFGDGICVPHGNKPTTPLPEFLAKLNPADGGHPLWANKPTELEIEANDSIKVVVRGGEFHTFTEVPFTEGLQAGCFAGINVALELTNPPTQAQCDEFFATTGVVAYCGSTLTVSGLSEGSHLFMCEIHPWMRTVVTVEGDHEDDD